MAYERKFGDELNSKDNRLKYTWEWRRIASQISEYEIKKWTHFQCSHSKVNEEWTLEAIQWGTKETVRYEARVAYMGNKIISEEDFATRIEAQIRAEKLLYDWIKLQNSLIE